MTNLLQVLQGDALAVLRTLPDESVHCCVTSPPYWGLRDYGTATWEGGDPACDHSPRRKGQDLSKSGLSGSIETQNHQFEAFKGAACPKCGAKRTDSQIGLEKTPAEYVAKMVEVFGEVRRVLRNDGTLWLNLGDSYNSRPCSNGRSFRRDRAEVGPLRGLADGLKDKDLIGIPWLVAFALRQDGWYLRSEITWCKKAPMPESVLDRPTSATEKMFLLTKSAKYWYDAEAVRNPPSESFLNDSRWKTGPTPENEKNGYADAGAQNPKQVHRIFNKPRGHVKPHEGLLEKWDAIPRGHANVYGSNMRNYWVLGPEPYKNAHFATFPTEVPRKCILAGCPLGGAVLDPFAGSGTTGQVALELGRKAVMIELNPAYIELIHQRTNVTPGFAKL